MAQAVYILCALTSAGVAALLVQKYRQSRSRLLLWSSVCFVGLFLNNVVLFVDLVVTGPDIDLSWLRSGVALAGVLLLLYGLIWEVE